MALTQLDGYSRKPGKRRNKNTPTHSCDWGNIYKNHTHQHELLNILHRNLPFTFPGSPLKYSNMMGPRNKIYHREIKADM